VQSRANSLRITDGAARCAACSELMGVEAACALCRGCLARHHAACFSPCARCGEENAVKVAALSETAVSGEMAEPPQPPRGSRVLVRDLGNEGLELRWRPDQTHSLLLILSHLTAWSFALFVTYMASLYPGLGKSLPLDTAVMSSWLLVLGLCLQSLVWPRLRVWNAVRLGPEEIEFERPRLLPLIGKRQRCRAQELFSPRSESRNGDLPPALSLYLGLEPLDPLVWLNLEAPEREWVARQIEGWRASRLDAKED